MRWFRTIRPLIGMFVGLFVLAQFAGVVSAPLTGAWGSARSAASHAHHHHTSAGDVGGMVHEHDGPQHQNRADFCCALHAFFAGVLPSVAAVASMTLNGQRVSAILAQTTIGLAPDRLDRPPKPLL